MLCTKSSPCIQFIRLIPVLVSILRPLCLFFPPPLKVWGLQGCNPALRILQTIKPSMHMIHNSSQASVGCLDFPRPTQAAQRRKWPNFPCRGEPVWSGRRGAVEWAKGGRETKAQYVGLSPESRVPLNGCRMSILGLLPSPRRQGGLCPAEMLDSFVGLPLCGEMCL